MPLLRSILAMLALACQLALGPLPAQARLDADAALRLREVAILCTGASLGHPPPVAPQHRPAPDDGAVGWLDPALELPAIILTPAAALPRSLVLIVARAQSCPPSRAPPTCLAAGPSARGPPCLA